MCRDSASGLMRLNAAFMVMTRSLTYRGPEDGALVRCLGYVVFLDHPGADALLREELLLRHEVVSERRVQFPDFIELGQLSGRVVAVVSRRGLGLWTSSSARHSSRRSCSLTATG